MWSAGTHPREKTGDCRRIYRGCLKFHLNLFLNLSGCSAVDIFAELLSVQPVLLLDIRAIEAAAVWPELSWAKMSSAITHSKDEVPASASHTNGFPCLVFISFILRLFLQMEISVCGRHSFWVQNRKWNQLVGIAVMTCKVVAADCTGKFLLADRARRKKSLCVWAVSYQMLFVIFPILQGHLVQAQSSHAGMWAAQSELTQ